MILRRYTPPTCTLEITAKSSLFSRWKSRYALEDLHFELHFDAPQLPEEQQVKLRGDRAQLQALSDAVNSYVHKFLCQSAIALDVLGLTKKEESDKETTAKAESERENRQFSEPAPPAATLRQPAAPPVAEVVGEIEEDDNPAQLEPEPTVETNAPISEGIYLQPRGLLGHDLFLGSLATPESGAVVHLDVLQLFDLATAIEQYEAEAEAPPARPNWFKQTPSWAKIAALVVLSVGVTAGAIELLNRNTSLQMASQKAAPPPSPVVQQPVAVAPPPAPVPAPPPAPAPAPAALQLTPAPVPSPTSRLPKLPKILEDGDVAATPNPSQFPAQPNLQAPNVARLPSLNTAPAPQRTLAGAPNSAPSGASSSTTAIQIPPPPPTIIPQIPPPPNTQVPPLSIPPESTADAGAIDNATPNTVATLPRIEPESTPAEAPPDVVLKTPEPAPTQAAPTETAPTQAAAVPRNAEPAPPLPRIEGLPDGAPEKQAANTPSPSPAAQSIAPENTAPEAIAPATADTPAPVEEARGSLLNEATQVVEAKNYFQQRWQPQPDLTQPLEYTLSLNPDGSIQQFTPRGELSGKFVERTGMPLMNEKFVSPLQEGKGLRIRVLLKPDGKVQAFEEPIKEDL